MDQLFVRSELASDGPRFGVLEGDSACEFAHSAAVSTALGGRDGSGVRWVACKLGRQNKVEGRQAPAQP